MVFDLVGVWIEKQKNKILFSKQKQRFVLFLVMYLFLALAIAPSLVSEASVNNKSINQHNN
jgi:hypothetical protein